MFICTYRWIRAGQTTSLIMEGYNKKDCKCFDTTGIEYLFPTLTPASKTLRPLVVGEPELFLAINTDFWRFRQI